MKITLAYPHDGHEADETVDLPGPEARRLLFDGKARLPANKARSVENKARRQAGWAPRIEPDPEPDDDATSEATQVEDPQTPRQTTKRGSGRQTKE